MTERKYYKMSPIEIVKDLKKRNISDPFTLKFLQKEIKYNPADEEWKFKLIQSYIESDLLQEYVK